MNKLLWVGDAVCDTGFARCTHKILDTLVSTWDVSVLGLNYFGDPHKYPYDIYPCMPGGDLYGIGRMSGLTDALKPDLIVIQQDPWNVPAYVKSLQTARIDIPVVGFIAVDGLNCNGEALKDLTHAIFWTKFAENEAKKGGYKGPTSVIPLGVDLDVYKPRDRQEVRKLLKLNTATKLDNAFIVGNINRNQPRKRLDLTVKYFCQWIKEYNIKDAFLFLHVCPTGELHCDLQQLMHYYGLRMRLIFSAPPVGSGLSEELLSSMYSIFDVQMTTTQGEGFGLPTLEGMACGIPQIVPRWSALGEWTAETAYQVPCTTTAIGPPYVNVIGGIPDEEEFIVALNNLYQTVELRDAFSKHGLNLVNQECYRWSNIGKEFNEVITSVLRGEYAGCH